MKSKIVIVECKEEQLIVATAEPEECICTAKKILGSLDPSKTFKAYIYPKPEQVKVKFHEGYQIRSGFS
ncbi:MAG TPA: hypothetical protein DDY49_05890 [Paenibacillaceae bacterium]|nr:hypothetical protein [Paenibacillaceae bacterium]